MPRAQSLTSLSLNFISQETLAGSSGGESTRVICVLASPGVSRVMDPLERGKGWPLARTPPHWTELCFHGSMAALKPEGGVTQPQSPECPSSSPPETSPHAGTSLKHGCLKALLPGTDRPREPGCQLGSSSCNHLPAATGPPRFLVCGAKSKGRWVTLGNMAGRGGSTSQEPSHCSWQD